MVETITTNSRRCDSSEQDCSYESRKASVVEVHTNRPNIRVNDAISSMPRHSPIGPTRYEQVLLFAFRILTIYIGRLFVSGPVYLALGPTQQKPGPTFCQDFYMFNTQRLLLLETSISVSCQVK